MAAKPEEAENEDLSMEEILQSIRKIISDEGEEVEEGEEVKQETAEAKAEPETASDESTMTEEEAKPEEETVEATGSDVLELTDMVEEEPTEEPPAEEPAEAVDVLQEIDEALEEEKPAEEATAETAEEAPPEAEPPAQEAAAPSAPTTAPSDESRLLSDNAATASAASLKKVVETNRSANPSPHFRSGTSVEELVLESLKPMLKEWLDDNLPSMVERIVEREIRKLVD